MLATLAGAANGLRPLAARGLAGKNYYHYIEQFFLRVGEKNFGNKILLLFPLDMRHYNFISIGHDTDYWVLHST